MDIRIRTEQPDLVAIQAKGTYPIDNILNWLQLRGYRIKNWIWKYEDETFPGGKTYTERPTFCALLPGEKPAESNMYLEVLNKELTKIFHEF